MTTGRKALIVAGIFIVGLMADLQPTRQFSILVFVTLPPAAGLWVLWTPLSRLLRHRKPQP